MDNRRCNISPCSPQEAAVFIAKLNPNEYIRRGFVMADNSSHYDRYTYTCGKDRIAIVYDTLACVLSITAPVEASQTLLNLFAPSPSKNVKFSTVPAPNAAKPNFSGKPSQNDVFADPAEALTAIPPSRTRAKVFAVPGDRVPVTPTDSMIFTARGSYNADSPLPPQPSRNMPTVPSVITKTPRRDYTITSKPRVTPPASQNTVRRATISFGSAEGEDGYIKKAPHREPALNTDAEEPPRRRGRPSKYELSRQNQYFQDAKQQTSGAQQFTAQQSPMQGVAQSGYNPQNKFAQSAEQQDAPQWQSSYNQAARQNQYPQDVQNKRRGRPPKSREDGKAIDKSEATFAKLKKRLPCAFEYLTEQPRIDFSFGLSDFEKSELGISDYSVLLVPPYRALERLVIDLQRAEGINVKMIGQAYDKDESGRYILKRGYQRRIDSVVYCEVMVSLYNEYCARRNFFAHSDNTDGTVSRSITDRAAAKRIFDNLLCVVEYNGKKLKEIGFSLDNPIGKK